MLSKVDVFAAVSAYKVLIIIKQKLQKAVVYGKIVWKKIVC